MLNKEKHQLIMGQILKDIYTDTAIASWLGLKGGTSAYFFYGLPRFSVDLDFDLLTNNPNAPKLLLKKLAKILSRYGQIKDKYLKRYTIFLLLSYGDADHNIKIEINTRGLPVESRDCYELKEHLGLSLLAAKPDYLFAGKLAALTLRSKTAMRDVYDIYYFAKNRWDINIEIIKARTGKNIKEHLADCLATIEKIKDSQILQGLGELLSDQDKTWVRANLKTETIFLLKNYLSALK
ncbi:MAG: nucleotidyl transferase AbiEii/AbiGii toxin family protein [bacterium]